MQANLVGLSNVLRIRPAYASTSTAHQGAIGRGSDPPKGRSLLYCGCSINPMMLPIRQITRTATSNVITIQTPTLGNLPNFSDIGCTTLSWLVEEPNESAVRPPGRSSVADLDAGPVPNPPIPIPNGGASGPVARWLGVDRSGRYVDGCWAGYRRSKQCTNRQTANNASGYLTTPSSRSPGRTRQANTACDK